MKGHKLKYLHVLLPLLLGFPVFNPGGGGFGTEGKGFSTEGKGFGTEGEGFSTEGKGFGTEGKGFGTEVESFSTEGEDTDGLGLGGGGGDGFRAPSLSSLIWKSLALIFTSNVPDFFKTFLDINQTIRSKSIWLGEYILKNKLDFNTSLK